MRLFRKRLVCREPGQSRVVVLQQKRDGGYCMAICACDVKVDGRPRWARCSVGTYAYADLPGKSCISSSRAKRCFRATRNAIFTMAIRLHLFLSRQIERKARFADRDVNDWGIGGAAGGRVLSQRLAAIISGRANRFHWTSRPRERCLAAASTRRHSVRAGSFSAATPAARPSLPLSSSCRTRRFRTVRSGAESPSCVWPS